MSGVLEEIARALHERNLIEREFLQLQRRRQEREETMLQMALELARKVSQPPPAMPIFPRIHGGRRRRRAPVIAIPFRGLSRRKKKLVN